MSEHPAIKRHQYGMSWGGADMRCFFDDPKKGWVVFGLITKKYPHGLQIYVTKSGKVRVSDENSEWKPKGK